ncbi:MAG: PhzF family phenazine biosynthesis protein [Verrucomicrobiota bacterium]
MKTKTIQQYQVDAFTDRIFGGNPAAVVPLEREWLPTATMQAIAMENQLSETAFFVQQDDGFALRWFTPTVEVDLCGHATLASAHVLFEELAFARERIVFHGELGELIVTRHERGYAMDFPIDTIGADREPAEAISAAIGAPVEEVFRGRHDLMAVLAEERLIRELRPSIPAIASLDARGLLVTAPGDETDFVSRCFFPRTGIDEDPVTGSAHTTMSPYWGKRLGKEELRARQLSKRIGDLICRVGEERVVLIGNAVTFSRGAIAIPEDETGAVGIDE